MCTAVVREIPPGAEVTVFLHNGKSFKGVESTPEALRNDKILRLEHHLSDSGPDGSKLVFVTHHDNVQCFELFNYR
jgi:hypothetical protein